MKRRRLDFNYKPLTMLKSIETVGNIPQHQLYDSVTGEYEPDYTLVGFALAIQPHVSAVYTDGTGESGEVTTSDELTNIVWKEIINGTTTVITDSTPGYTVITSGENKCRLIMSKNLALGTAVTLKFECDYLDTRTNDIHHVIESTLVTVAATESTPSFSLDRPGTTIWNPFGDVRNEGTEQAPNYVRRVLQEIVYNASLMVNGAEVAVDKREFLWEVKRPDGTWTPIGTEYNGIPDLGWSITNNGATFTQQTYAIGEKMEMRCRVRYGDLSTATFSDASPVEHFTMVRRLPDYDYDYFGVPDNLEAGIKNVYPEAYVEDRYGRVELRGGTDTAMVHGRWVYNGAYDATTDSKHQES